MFIELEQAMPELCQRIREIAWEVGFEMDRVISTVVATRGRLPPLPEQHRIVEYLDGVQAQVVAGLERLSGAVLARAFRGEL